MLHPQLEALLKQAMECRENNDLQGAIKHFKSATIRYSSIDAYLGLGQTYLELEEGDKEKNRTEGIKYLVTAAIKGNTSAQYNLGCILEDGLHGQAVNYQTAERYYRMAAEQKHPFAAQNLGAMYAYGRGNEIDKNPNEAVIWFKVAKEGGIDKVEHLLVNNQNKDEKNWNSAAITTAIAVVTTVGGLALIWWGKKSNGNAADNLKPGNNAIKIGGAVAGGGLGLAVPSIESLVTGKPLNPADCIISTLTGAAAGYYLASYSIEPTAIEGSEADKKGVEEKKVEAEKVGEAEKKSEEVKPGEAEKQGEPVNATSAEEKSKPGDDKKPELFKQETQWALKIAAPLMAANIAVKASFTFLSIKNVQIVQEDGRSYFQVTYNDSQSVDKYSTSRILSWDTGRLSRYVEQVANLGLNATNVDLGKAAAAFAGALNGHQDGTKPQQVPMGV